MAHLRWGSRTSSSAIPGVRDTHPGCLEHYFRTIVRPTSAEALSDTEAGSRDRLLCGAACAAFQAIADRSQGECPTGGEPFVDPDASDPWDQVWKLGLESLRSRKGEG